MSKYRRPRMSRLLLSMPLCLLLAFVAVFRSLPPAQAEAAAADQSAPLPDTEAIERLVKTDPVAFMRVCLQRYDREVKGYRCTFVKQERLGGKLQRSEVID